MPSIRQSTSWILVGLVLGCGGGGGTPPGPTPSVVAKTGGDNQVGAAGTALSTPLEVRRAIEYVLKNHRHHFGDHAARFDPCSSAAWFDGWRSPPARGDGPQAPVRPPKSWLLRIGWRRHGLLEV